MASKLGRELIVGALALLFAGACSDDDGGTGSPLPDGGGDAGQPALFATVAETKRLVVGQGPVVARFGAGGLVELDIPAGVVAQPRTIDVSLVTGTVRRGRYPVNDAGLYVQPQGLVFAQPVKVRQPVPPPGPGKRYVAVVIPDGSDTFVARTPGRRLEVQPPDVLAMGLEMWEGEGDGSGLWGFALDEGGVDVVPDAGVTAADAGATLEPGSDDPGTDTDGRDAAAGMGMGMGGTPSLGEVDAAAP